MIYITRLNRVSIVLNSQLIEHIETTPDTVISLTTGEKLRVLESADEIVARVVEFQRRIRASSPNDLSPPLAAGIGRAGQHE